MAATKSVEYVDSREFCTGVCHTPMQPEAVAHRRSVHANIGCTSCQVTQLSRIRFLRFAHGMGYS